MIKIERINEDEAKVTVKGNLGDLMAETAMAVDKVCECISESHDSELSFRVFGSVIDEIIADRSKDLVRSKDDADSDDSVTARKASVALSIISQILKNREGDPE